MVTLLKGLKHIGLDLTLGMGSAFADAMQISAVIDHRRGNRRPYSGQNNAFG